MMHVEQETMYALGQVDTSEHSDQQVSANTRVLTCALQTGPHQASAHVKAVVYHFVQYALQALRVA